MHSRNISDRVFAVLLRAYPRRFRDAFEPELRVFFRDDRLWAARKGGVAVVRMWTRTLSDLIGSAWRQRTRRDSQAALPAARSQLTPAGVRPVPGGPPLPSLPPRNGKRMSDLLQDLAYGSRSLIRDPGFSAIAVLTLALGVGATTGVFSVVDAVLLRPLPYPDEERLLYIGTYFPGSDELSVAAEGNIVDLQERTTTLDAVAGSNEVSFTMLGNGDPELIDAAAVGLDFLPMFGVRPALGRGFVAADFEPGAADVAILEHGFWRERWNGDVAALGSTMTLDHQPYTIIGVAPEDFVPPEAVNGHADARMWVPLRMSDPPQRTSYGLQVLGRLAPGVTLDAAIAEIDRIFRAQTAEYGLKWEVGGGAVTLRQRTLGTSGEAIWLLQLGVGFLLLIACANVANLMLARGTRRHRELAVRLSLGAGRGRIVRQLLTESMVLALAGGLAGALLSYWGVQAFKAANPGGIPRLSEVAVDLRVLLAGLVISTAVGILFGLAPALQGFRTDASVGLRPAAGATRGSTGGRGTRAALVVVEAALALMLLIGASLLVNSFVRMSRVDPGFDGSGLMSMRVNLRNAYPDRERWLPLFHALMEEVEAIPGVRTASMTTSLPFAGIGVMQQVAPLDSVEGEGELPFIPSTFISADHFRNMGMSLLEGEGFPEKLPAEAPPPVIVNDAMAAAYWPDAESVIGKRIRLGDKPDDEVVTIVGRVGSLRYRYDQQQRQPEMYFHMDTQAWRSMWVMARVDGDAGDPSAIARPMREALWRIDPDLPIDRVASVDELAWNSIGRPRFYSALAASLAAVALALALVGLYGTLSYAVGARVRELGIRLALGAPPSQLVALVLRGGLRVTVLGLLLGASGAWGVSRLLERFLFAVEPTDLPTFVGAASLFLITAIFASWLPARRAARLDPVQALRTDA